MTTVPAVPGRVVRFNGSLLHAVPRPHDAWLHPRHGNASEHGYNRFAPDAPARSRDVLLFNTWADFAPQSLRPAEAGPDAPPVHAEPLSSWRELRVQTVQQVAVAATDDEASAGVLEPAAGEAAALRVDMMGDCLRRGRDERELRMELPGGTKYGAAAAATAERALADVHQAWTVPLDAGAPSGGMAPQPASRACRETATQPQYGEAELSQMLKTLRARGEGAPPILEKLRPALSEAGGLADVPNDLILELAAVLLDLNDVAAARMAASQAVGPAARRLSRLLGAQDGAQSGTEADGVPALYARRASRLAEGTRPTPLFGSVLELPQNEWSVRHFAERCAAARRPCVLRQWLASKPRLGGFDALIEACGSVHAPLWTLGAHNTPERMRIQRNGAWTDDVPLRLFLSQPKGGAYVDSVGLDRDDAPTCRALLERAYTIPFAAADDYLRRAGAGRNASGQLGQLGGPPFLSVHHSPAKAPLQVTPDAAQRAHVVHAGAQEAHFFALSTDEVGLYLYPEHALADRFDGAALEEASLSGGAADAFPSVWPVVSSRYPLLQWAHEAARVRVALEAGDVLLVPDGMPHAIHTTSMAVTTSIDFVDAHNWARARPRLLQSDAALVERIDALHAESATARTHEGGDVPFGAWATSEAQRPSMNSMRPSEAEGQEGHDEL